MFTLKALRANKSWSQKDAAVAVGVSIDTWSNWERGKSFPDVPKICRIEKVFNVRYNELIFLNQDTV